MGYTFYHARTTVSATDIIQLSVDKMEGQLSSTRITTSLQHSTVPQHHLTAWYQSTTVPLYHNHTTTSNHLVHSQSSGTYTPQHSTVLQYSAALLTNTSHMFFLRCPSAELGFDTCTGLDHAGLREGLINCGWRRGSGTLRFYMFNAALPVLPAEQVHTSGVFIVHSGAQWWCILVHSGA